MKIKEQKGFSLVELMIVVAILAILGAIAVPSFQRYAIDSDLKSAARDIQGDFFLYKERAIAENRQYAIAFNVGANNYTINDTPSITKTPSSFRSDISLTGTTGGSPIGTYEIQPRGTVAPGTISLINSRNSTATITINITGKTYVQFNMQ